MNAVRELSTMKERMRYNGTELLNGVHPFSTGSCSTSTCFIGCALYKPSSHKYTHAVSKLILGFGGLRKVSASQRPGTRGKANDGEANPSFR